MSTPVAELIVSIERGKSPPECHIQLGGDSSNPTWDEYVNQWVEEWQPHCRLIRKAIKEGCFIGETGESFADDHYFKFSDGSSIAFTWRAWGDLMQAIANRREGYMAYYM